ncbi:MAG: hypothetical protein KDK27_13115, partial [Leptospiraceae bacterium]|nr:hypothetical protein [Leptospiraceae bacterium]
MCLTYTACAPVRENTPVAFEVQPHNPGLRPWQNSREQINYMLLLADFSAGPGSPELTAAERNRCVERIHASRENLQSNDRSNNSSARQAAPGRRPDRLPGGEENRMFGPLGQSEAETAVVDECAQALASCGSCHLPARNNCNYRVEYIQDGERREQYGQLVSNADQYIYFGRRGVDGDDSTGMRIPKKDIVRSVWLNG